MDEEPTPKAYVYPEVRQVTDDELRASLKLLAQDAHGVPPLAVHRRAIRGALQGLEDGENLTQGNEVIFYQWLNEGGKHLSRSCAVRVDDVSEIVRLLEGFFKV